MKDIEKAIIQLRNHLVQLTIVRFDSKVLNKAYENTYNAFPDKLLHLIKEREERIVERVKALKVPDDWNKGYETEKRYKDILSVRGTIMELYNRPIDDAIKAIKEGDK